ncbi:MAG: hypothetical protein AUJ75_00010 [Candidatus Omnitrophica bacterium CG1_02_49_10]|nr:MAG: hypothetical protein AUJ75_00010 [Candidatus Omnitrophica bacterium CG1_02_49_10]
MIKQGLILSILAALAWGFAPALAKTGLYKVDPLMGVALRTIAVAVVLIFAMAFSGKAADIAKLDMKSVAFIISEGLLAGLLGQWLYYKALKSWEASKVVPIAGSYPMIAAIVAILILGERITIEKGLGVALVVLGIFFLR